MNPAFSVMISFHDSRFCENYFVPQKWQRENHHGMKKGVYSLFFVQWYILSNIFLLLFLVWGFLKSGRGPQLVCKEYCFSMQTPTLSGGVLGLLMLTQSIVTLNNYWIAANITEYNKPFFRSVATSQGCGADMALVALLFHRERCFTTWRPTQSRGVLFVLTTT